MKRDIDFIERCTVDAEIGCGGMDLLYWATDNRIARGVAVEALPAHLAGVDVTYRPSARLGLPGLVMSDPTLLIRGVRLDGRFPAIQCEPMPEITTLNLLIGFDRVVEEME